MVVPELIGVGTKESFAPPSEPNGRISRIKCGRPHLMRYVAFPLMWRWIRTPRPERAELRWTPELLQQASQRFERYAGEVAHG
jgi:hypothetical protein